jgi:hypothetical protein
MIRREGWKKPASGVYKLNVDAAFDADSGRGATGAIIRDAGGNFIAPSCEFTDYTIDAAAMEASALLAGLKLAEQFGARSLVVESDSMEIVQVVLDPSEYRGSSAVVVDDCRHLLMMLGMATIQHCPREANGAAHELARFSSLQGARVFWFTACDCRKMFCAHEHQCSHHFWFFEIFQNLTLLCLKKLCG